MTFAMSFDDMEDSGRMPLDHHHRSSDGGSKRFFRFDPTVSTGTLIQIASIMVGFAIAYGTYREDQTKVKADIEAVHVSAERDRADLKSAVADVRIDMKDVKDRVSSIDRSLTILQATQQAAQQQTAARR